EVAGRAVGVTAADLEEGHARAADLGDGSRGVRRVIAPVDTGVEVAGYGRAPVGGEVGHHHVGEGSARSRVDGAGAHGRQAGAVEEDNGSVVGLVHRHQVLPAVAVEVARYHGPVAELAGREG